MIYLDVDLPHMYNMQLVPEQHEELGSDGEIDHEVKVLGGIQDYILIHDREHRSPKPLERYGYEDLASYELIISVGNCSTF